VVIGVLTALVGATALAVWALGRAVTVSTRGRRMLAAKLREYRHLAPSESPDLAAYGPGGAELAVALFGSPALAALNPQLARLRLS
jgi:uncharacterized protein (TIGR04222 family)